MVEQKPNSRRKLVVYGILLALIIFAAAFLRFRGLLWGEYQYLHPDERFLIWVGTDISPVNSLAEYWDTVNSSLNPHNRGHGFYVYGTLPLYLARYAVDWVYGHSGFNEMTDVGRFLSAIADLLTVLFVYLIAEKVYNRRVGLLSAAFSAFAVLQIQQSHFFTVDTFTTFFSMLAIYFAAKVAYDKNKIGTDSNERDPTADKDSPELHPSRIRQLFANPILLPSIGFGIALGLAASSKISVAPLALLLPVAMFIRLIDLKGIEQQHRTQDALLSLILAGFVSLLVFRIFQPMAFTGPGFFGIIPNEAWLANLRELQNQASGDVDFPPALQWARRPIWFAWQNIVLWGMGLPMGLLVWSGFLWIGWRIVKGDWRKHILLWGWAALIFVWQSLIFNPSMRYQLPIYPLLAIFAGWVVIRIFDWRTKKITAEEKPGKGWQIENAAAAGVNTRSTFNWTKVIAIIIGSGVLIATAVYAISFSNIYTRPITRVEASRWIYQNIPGPINLPIQTLDGEFNQPIPYPYNYVINSDTPFVNGFSAKQSGDLAGVKLGSIIDPYANFGDKEFRLTISEDPGGRGRSESISLEADISPGEAGSISSFNVSLDQPFELSQGEEYFIMLSLPPGHGPVIVNGSLDISILGESLLDQSIPVTEAIVDSINTHQSSFVAQASGLLTDITLNIVSPGNPQERTIVVALYGKPDGSDLLAEAALSGVFYPGDGFSSNDVAFNNLVSLEEGQQYYLNISMNDPSGGIMLRGTPIANEGAWDDGLPVRLDGYDGFAGIFEPGLNFDMYEDDNPNKLTRFYDILDHAEYLLISSSRQWGTLPRLPERYPMNSEYYRRLMGCPNEYSVEACYNIAQVGDFRGDLGFELVEVFQSDPGIGPLSLNDQSSEEAFTVYDHPKVLIFQKTPDYNPNSVRAILGAVDLSQVEHITPKKAGALPKDMMLPVDRLISQYSGGTWSQLFDFDNWQNRWPIVTLIIWYLAIALLGLIAYPILRLALSGLADRGYPLARVAGLLILSYVVWLAGSLKIPFSRTTITVVMILFMGLSAVMIYLQRASLRKEWRERRNYFLLIEGLFLAFFIFDLVIRLGNPDLWHPWKGGEKPMDFSYLNAVIKSTSFPPFDPWFAGGYINYYYYGFVLVGVMIKWLGIVPSIAYNLFIPTLFSMMAMGAFSIGWNLISAGRSGLFNRKPLLKSLPFITGIAAAIGVAVIGNLGTLRMILLGYQRLAAPGGNIEGANVIIQSVWTIRGALMTLTGAALPYGIADWYWLPSRVIPAPNDVEPITEFPFFTVLYGDPHAHLFALPLTLLALGWALSVVLGKGWRVDTNDSKARRTLRISTSLLLGGLAIGALRPTNTWDFPIYLVFGLLAVGYAVWMNYASSDRARIENKRYLFNFQKILIAIGAIVLLGLLSVILYQPYANWYVQGYSDINIWEGSHTPFWSYMTHWGVFLFVIISWMIWETREWMAETPLSRLRKLSPFRVHLLIGCLVLLALIIALLIWGVSIAWIVLPVVVWAAILLLRSGLSDAKRFVLVLIGAGLSLTLMVELIVLVGDIGRMNTVFKFYLQVWTLLALSSAAGFGWIITSFKRWLPSWRAAWQMILILLVASAALYPLLGGAAKIKDRMAPDAPHTLDGMAFMAYAEYDDLGTRMDLSQDQQAIRWLQENVLGSPVIIEGNMVEYHWGTRNTIYTGLPNVIGWNWHQRQQRALSPEYLIPERISDVNEFYITSDPSQTKDILDKYGVEYVIVGQLEQALYPGQGLEKFSTLQGVLWQEVFRFEDTVIYQVIG